MRKGLGWLLGLAALLAAAFGGSYYYQYRTEQDAARRIQTITAASLTGLREQARLTPFLARFVAVVTSRQQRLGLSAERTMIMPGTVRYELDLTAIRPQDLVWDEEAKRLDITLPPLILDGPQVDLQGIRQYGENGLLTLFTDAAQTLDDTNKKVAQAELMKQAQGAVPMRLAREAARNAIERSFVMPLRAAGIEATVSAHFAGEKAGKPADGAAAAEDGK